MKHPVFFGFLAGIAVLTYLNSGEEQSGSVKTPEAMEAPASSAASGVAEAPSLAGPVEASFAPPGNPELSADLSLQINNVQRVLPSLKELQSLPEDEIHGTPSRIIEAGAALGALEEYLERRPDEFPGASGFFSECAAGADLPPSIRAMCLHSLRNNPTQWAPGVSARLEALPAEVVDLEAQL